MRLAVACPHCGHTAQTEKQADRDSEVVCAKCHMAFHVSDEVNEKVKELVFHESAMPIPETGVGKGRAYSTLVVDADESKPAGSLPQGYVARELDTKKVPLPELPEEPWFYGSLWRYGQALRFFADGGALVFFMWSLIVYMDFGGKTKSEQYTGFALASFISWLFVVGLIWFILRLVSAAVLLMVDVGRNIRSTWFATKFANFQ